MKTRKEQIIYINCWKCGQVFATPEREYRNGLICEKCY